MKIVIIGGVAGGASAAARMRRLDEQAEIIILERDAYVSYANCGLPYYIGDTILDKEDLSVQTPLSLRRRLNLDVRVRNEAISIDRAAKSVTVKKLEDGSTYVESYDKLLLSPGASAVRPPIPGADNEKVFYLRTVPDTLKIKDFVDDEEPGSVAIIGAGVIGLELAENLFRLGIDVTVIEKLDQVIPNLDADMAKMAAHHLEEKGVELILGNGVKAIEEDESGLKLLLDEGEVKADCVFMCVGVKPETSIARDCGLELTDRGTIIVNDRMQTSDNDIYAVGDAIQVKNFVTGKSDYIPLAGPANKQGRIAANNIFGYDSAYQGTQGSFIMKLFKKTIACTGLNERDALAAGLDFDKTYLSIESHATYYPDFEIMNIKVIFEKPSGRILGAQLIGGEGTDKRCDVIASAIRAGMTGFDLTNLELCYAPPYSSAKDPVNMVGYVIENLLTGKYRQVFWHDLVKMRDEMNAQIIDLRPMDSFMDGFIDGAKNIPLAQLRLCLDKIDKSRPVLLYCVKGQNSYIASRALSQMGYDCYSLSGGFRTFEMCADEEEIIC